VQDAALERRVLDELDAVAAALAARALARGTATWLGDPAEGVIVLPESRRRRAYTR
jgi:predicted nuclease with RNAse H fold